MEKWVDIKGYDGLYQVSDYGRVRRTRTRFGNEAYKILKPYIGPNRRPYVTLSKNGVTIRKYVHRLVAEAFVPNEEGYWDVVHSDHNPENNRADNLFWQKERTKEPGVHAKRPTSKRYKQEYFSKEIIQYSFDGKVVRRWRSLDQIREELGHQYVLIRTNCQKKCKSAYGYVWGYAEDGAPAKYYKKSIVQMDKNGNIIREYDTVAKAVQENGYCHTPIYKCCKGYRKSYKGFIWKYKKDL